MTPRISIVIPALNEELLLERTLACFSRDLREQYRLEVIVSDGGSTDSTLTIAERHADVVVRHTDSSRQTIAAGRNRGAEVARGDVIVFINGDTYPADTRSFLEVITAFAERTGRYARASALACAVHFPPQERKPLDGVFHWIYNHYVALLNAMRIGAGRGECQVVRADVFRAVKGYRDTLAAGEDFDLLARISRRARVRFAAELLVFESPRRFRKFGYFRILFWWTVNALFVMFAGRSSSDEWEPVR